VFLLEHDAAEPLTRIVVADDHEPTRFLLRTLLEFVPTVEVVAEATTGREAVDRVLELQADIVLLDVEMPVMDGFTAAELIGSHRPSTRVILHTAYADAVKRDRAEALGLPLLVEQGFDETMAAAAEKFDAAKKGAPGPTAVEGIVLSALAARTASAMVVVAADEGIPFYTAGAAELLGLPFPVQPMTLEEMHDANPLVDRLGEPYPRAESPLSKALDGQRKVEGEMSERLPNGSLRSYWLSVVPLFDPTGQFLGVASYTTVLAETRPTQDPAEHVGR
jgi:DNA-binding NarL/FixJ family response regulator